MTLSISQLRDRVAVQFPDVEQVDDSVIRFTKRVGDQPYAVYYLDVAEGLPESQETLMKYQDRVIGKHYFESNRSLQWSNYLYFVTSHDSYASNEVQAVRELIEGDRSYARKFVIPEDEIDSVLSPRIVAPTQASPHAGILSVWTERLFEAGLDRVILSDADLPTRLRLIENPPIAPSSIRKMPQTKLEVSKESFIHSLLLKGYRDFPLQRNFNFGTVNLICGANGSGKTSLLEAIELFYCGRNKRNPTSSPSYHLIVDFADGRTEKALASRRLQIFRDRNLAWYGQPEVLTNKLYQSFGQFNYLDTDAAVDLSESVFRIEDDLSKLLVGSEAAEVWRNIERVSSEVAKNLDGLNPLKFQIEEELALLKKRLSEDSSARQESGSIRERLEKMIGRVGWRAAQDDDETFADSLVEPLTELVSIARQTTKIKWAVSPISMEGMDTYCHDAKLALGKAMVGLSRLETLRKEQQKIEDAINRDRKASDIAKQLSRFIDADLLGREEELNSLQAKVAALTGWLAGLDTNALEAAGSTTDFEVSIADFQEVLTSKRSTAETSLAKLKKEYKEFSELRDQSFNLAQQLREMAIKILQSSRKPDECPLCHSQFESGELEKHINVGVDEHLEALGQTLLTQLREREIVLHDIVAIETASSSLMKFCGRAKLAVDISIHSALDEVNNTNRALIEFKERLKVLNREMNSLKSQGLSKEKLKGITDRLSELGYPINVRFEEDLNRLLLTIDQNEKSLSNALDIHRKELDELQRKLAESLDSADPEDQSLEGKLSQLRESLTAAEIFREKLGNFSSQFPWPAKRPLIELVVEAESIRNVAAELQDALDKESLVKISYEDSAKRQESLEKKLEYVLPKIERFRKAHFDLKRLQIDHSLNSAMEDALKENRTAIETIFSQIHSPAEFRGLGSNWSTLIRKEDGKKAELTEISSGQRAAFALSVFFAQNAKLKVAPPVVLIDDPIAHIDDMNSLSFLDYLREVALRGQRQIFFATADDKLAALFEHKFDFLGPDKFCRFNLTRNS